MHTPNENVTPSRSVLTKLLVRSWEYRHPRVFVAMRFASGLFNLGLGILMLSYGYWLGLAAPSGRGSALLGRLPHLPDHPEPACSSLTLKRQAFAP